MASLREPKIETLVLDAGPLIDRKPLRGLAKRYVTTPMVVKELKDPRARQYFEQLPLLEGVNVELRMPTVSSMAKAIAFAKKTGDFAVLSQPDLCVIALTIELDDAAKSAQKAAGPPAATMSEQLSAQQTQDLEKAVVEAQKDQQASELAVEMDNTEGPDDSDDEYVDALSQHEEFVDDVVEKLQATSLDAEQPPAEDSRSDESGPSEPASPAALSPQLPEVAAVASSSTIPKAPLYDDPSSDDDGDGEWITPTNVQKHQEKAKNLSVVPANMPADQILPVACMTADFAMQNCMIQMGLNLASHDGRKVSKVKTWVLRCHGCFKICKDQTKKFCPTCGGPTLNRTSVTLQAADPNVPNSAPKLIVHLKRNYQWKLRGTNESLPPPRVGRARGGGVPEIVLREDQKEWQRGLRSEGTRLRKEERRMNRAFAEKEKRGDQVWMDQDWVPQLLVGGASNRSRGLPPIGRAAGGAKRGKKRK